MDETTGADGASAEAPGPEPGIEPIEARLPRSPECGAVARRLVERHLGPHTSGTALDDLKLVVSELADNAYLHGEGEIRLALQPRGRFVRVEVIDEGQGAAIEIRTTAPEEQGGFGLKLIDGLSRAWGAYEGTTHVWADMQLD